MTSAWLTAGAHTLTLTVTDAAGAIGTDSVMITITTPNRPPIVSDTGATAVVGTPVPIALGATDIETCELTFSVVQAPGSGTLGAMQDLPCLAGSPNGDSAQITYTPGSAGTYTFTYKANDGNDDSNIGTVTVTVTEPNRPPTASNASASTVVGAPVTITLGAADIETCELTFSVVQAPASGLLGAIQNQPCGAGSPNIDTASITYTPGSAGTYTFTYKANDGSADSNIATVTIAVAAPPPPATLTVTGISPNVVSQNVGTRNFVITGTAFATGARVSFINGTGGQTPRVVSVTRDSSTQLTATVQIRDGGPRKNRLWDVQVTNPDGTTAVGARLLTITP
jgi:hypothetical protein